MTTTAQLDSLRIICDAIIEAIKAGGPAGASGGILYSALMGQGCSLNQFQSLMAGLIRAGKVRQEGQFYFAV